MRLVATLVSSDPLDPGLAARVVKAVRSDFAERLSDHATDVYCDGDLPAVRAAVADAIGEAAVDGLVQEAATRRKKLLLSDMDSTLIGQECIDELAAVHDLKVRVAEITARTMAGELPFEASLAERVALLEGIPVETIEALLRTVIRLSPGAATMVATLRRHGVRTVLVSGGFLDFAEPVAARLGIGAAYANRLLSNEGRLTGRVAAPILGPDAKLQTLLRECARLGIEPSEALALGDGANDLAMIERAGFGVAYRAKPKVAQEADGEIRHADLTAVLYAMGFRHAEFVVRADGAIGDAAAEAGGQEPPAGSRSPAIRPA